MVETTKELAARLRRQDRESQERFMQWGFTEEEKAQHAAEDAEYFALRALELETINHQAENMLADERIFERMRRQDRAR